jgi:hypothetical protein
MSNSKGWLKKSICELNWNKEGEAKTSTSCKSYFKKSITIVK